MKTFSRVILALILIVSLLFAFSILASAAEPTDDAPETANAVEAENGASKTVEQTEQKKSFASAVMDFFTDNSDTIFAGASLALTAVLMYFYRHGFIPSLSNSLNKFNNATNETMTVLADQNNDVAVKIATIAETISPFIARVDKLMKELSTLKSEKEAQAKIDKGVFDLLGLIIESGRVPDSVKEQYRLYKAKLDGEIEKVEGSGDSE